MMKKDFVKVFTIFAIIVAIILAIVFIALGFFLILFPQVLLKTIIYILGFILLVKGFATIVCAVVLALKNNKKKSAN